MVVTESELRQMWRDGKNALPLFPSGTMFTPSALDFLNSHGLQVHFETPGPAPSNGRYADSPEWDRPGTFPVVLTGPIPVCDTCGQPITQKPDHLTQLDSGHFAIKTHPRIKLRGRLDTLHALVMLTSAEARRYWLPELADRLDTLAAYCREIQSAEYNDRPVCPLLLGGKTEEEIHQISHHPNQYLGIEHIIPGAEDPPILHWMNYLRATAREVELFALEIYPHPDREDISRALNRLSSAVYVLELMFRNGSLSWRS